MKIQGTIESVKPVAAVHNLNEVLLVGDDRKFTIFDKTDKASGRVQWLATTMKEGDAYEFEYTQKANAKNPNFPYHNLSQPNNITGASVSSVPAPSVGGGESGVVCPHCGKSVMVGLYKE